MIIKGETIKTHGRAVIPRLAGVGVISDLGISAVIRADTRERFTLSPVKLIMSSETVADESGNTRWNDQVLISCVLSIAYCDCWDSMTGRLPSDYVRLEALLAGKCFNGRF